MRKLAMLSIIALLASACLGSDFADSVEGSWQLTAGTVDGEEIPILATHPVTMTLDGGEVSGTASCNGYSGTYELSESDISFGGLAMTEMACFPEETMRAEALFADAMTRVDTVAVHDGLTLTGDGVELRFDTAPDAG